jgi:hypothetical protein
MQESVRDGVDLSVHLGISIVWFVSAGLYTSCRPGVLNGLGDAAQERVDVLGGVGGRIGT